MKNKLIYPLIAAVLITGAACRGDRKSASQQQQFESVQEGSAAGVTSTIHGPGETLPPLTGTNADTTSAFALDPNAVPPAGQPGTIAGTLPQQPAPVPNGATYVPPQQPVARPTTPSRTSTYSPAQPQPSPQPRPVQQQPQPQPQQPTNRPEPVDPPPQPTETVEPQPVPPPTDTTATQPPPPTQTAPPPPAKPKEQQPEKPPAEEEDEGEQTETAPPPPPPAQPVGSWQ